MTGTIAALDRVLEAVATLGPADDDPGAARRLDALLDEVDRLLADLRDADGPPDPAGLEGLHQLSARFQQASARLGAARDAAARGLAQLGQLAGADPYVGPAGPVLVDALR